MLEHLFCNAHGEWAFIGAVLGAIPFVRAWLKARRAKSCCGDDDGHIHP